MFKIWVKTRTEDKLTRNRLFEWQDVFDGKKFRDYLYEICAEMDLPSPLVLPTHIRYFEEFNVVKFTPKDYVESVDFDQFTMEYCIDPDKKKQRDLRFYP